MGPTSNFLYSVCQCIWIILLHKYPGSVSHCLDPTENARFITQFFKGFVNSRLNPHATFIATFLVLFQCLVVVRFSFCHIFYSYNTPRKVYYQQKVNIFGNLLNNLCGRKFICSFLFFIFQFCVCCRKEFYLTMKEAFLINRWGRGDLNQTQSVSQKLLPKTELTLVFVSL